MLRDPTKLTPEVEKRLLDALRAGNYVSVAAGYARISRRTFYRWMKWGRECRSDRLRQFYLAVREAEIEAEVRAVAHLGQAMPTDWRAALAFLTHKFPRRWGNRKPRKSAPNNVGGDFRRHHSSQKPNANCQQPKANSPKPSLFPIDRIQQWLDEIFARDPKLGNLPEET